MIKGAKGAKRGGGWVDEVFRTCFVVEGGMVGGLGSMGCVVEFGGLGGFDIGMGFIGLWEGKGMGFGE